MTGAEFCRATGLSQRQLIYFVEKRIVRPAVDKGGRGNPRNYNMENFAEVRMAQLLLDLGFALHRVPAMIHRDAVR